MFLKDMKLFFLYFYFYYFCRKYVIMNNKDLKEDVNIQNDLLEGLADFMNVEDAPAPKKTPRKGKNSSSVSRKESKVTKDNGDGGVDSLPSVGRELVAPRQDDAFYWVRFPIEKSLAEKFKILCSLSGFYVVDMAYLIFKEGFDKVYDEYKEKLKKLV